MKAAAKKRQLTLGPLLYHWPAEKWMDFYARIADEAGIDRVYIGEVICSKREPFTEELLPKIVQRLKAGGKEVVISTLSVITTPREVARLKTLCASPDVLVEANDVSSLGLLEGKPFVCGPFINVFNEGALDFVIRSGAERIVPPVEMSGAAIACLAGAAGAAELEVLVYGRQPLALSMRCYSARAHGRIKDNCRFICQEDPDGMAAGTLDGRPLLRVNGTQTLSDGYLALAHEVEEMARAGVAAFRLSPQDRDMVKVAQVWRQLLDGKLEPDAALERLKKLGGGQPLMNGYYHAREGMAWVA